MKDVVNLSKGFILLCISTLSFWSVSLAQECTSYLPVKAGAEMEITHYNAADKLMSTTTMKIISKTNSPGGYTVKAKVKGTDEKGEQVVDKELSFKCKDGNFIWDMDDMLGDALPMMGEDYSVKMSGTDYKFPSKLSVGQKLEESVTTISIESNGMAVMNIDVTIKNRKVDALEKITTPAGTFNCFKISYDMEMKAMMNITMHGIDWISEGVGMVKSQQFDQNNKLEAYSLLNRFKE